MASSKSFWTGVLVSLFGLLAFTELVLRLSVPTGFWYRHFDLSGDFTTLPEFEDRLRFSVPKEHRVLLLGDSVLGASALTEHRTPDARSKTLSRYLGMDLQGDGYHALSLGSDGLLLPDIEGMSNEFILHPPSQILLLLNFRMFAKDFDEGPGAVSRKFLLPQLPEDIQKRLAPEKPPALEARLSDFLYGWMAEHWLLFRETQMAKILWYYPSQKDFFQRWLEKIAGQNETQSEIAEAALKQKIASYYQPYLWDKKGLPLESLSRLLTQWSENHVPVAVILTPQNPKFLGSYLDRPSFEKNRQILAAFMKPYLGKGISYKDWADRYPSTFFFDHCHLKPEGNERYAKDLSALVTRGAQ